MNDILIFDQHFSCILYMLAYAYSHDGDLSNHYIFDSLLCHTYHRIHLFHIDGHLQYKVYTTQKKTHTSHVAHSHYNDKDEPHNLLRHLFSFNRVIDLYESSQWVLQMG